MQINKISNINFLSNFKSSNINRDIESQNAILMLRDPKASVKFQQSQEFAQNADSVDTNPLKSLGYKLYRTFNMIRDNEQVQDDSSRQFSVIA